MLVRDEGDVWLIWVVAFLYGVSFVVLPAAVNGLLKELLPEELLIEANSSLATFKEGFRLFGPLVGAAIFATAGGWLVAVVDAATFVVAAAFIASIRVTETAAPPRTGFRDEVVAGLRFIVGDRVLRNVLIGLGASILVIGFFEASIYALLDAFDKAPTFAGVFVTVQGVGAIAGGLTASLVVRRLGEVGGAVVGLATMALATAVEASAPNMSRGPRRRGPAGHRDSVDLRRVHHADAASLPQPPDRPGVRDRRRAALHPAGDLARGRVAAGEPARLPDHLLDHRRGDDPGRAPDRHHPARPDPRRPTQRRHAGGAGPGREGGRHRRRGPLAS